MITDLISVGLETLSRGKASVTTCPVMRFSLQKLYTEVRTEEVSKNRGGIISIG